MGVVEGGEGGGNTAGQARREGGGDGMESVGCC